MGGHLFDHADDKVLFLNFVRFDSLVILQDFTLFNVRQGQRQEIKRYVPE